VNGTPTTGDCSTAKPWVTTYSVPAKYSCVPYNTADPTHKECCGDGPCTASDTATSACPADCGCTYYYYQFALCESCNPAGIYCEIKAGGNLKSYTDPYTGTSDTIDFCEKTEGDCGCAENEKPVGTILSGPTAIISPGSCVNGIPEVQSYTMDKGYTCQPLDSGQTFNLIPCCGDRTIDPTEDCEAENIWEPANYPEIIPINPGSGEKFDCEDFGYGGGNLGCYSMDNPDEGKRCSFDQEDCRCKNFSMVAAAGSHLNWCPEPVAGQKEYNNLGSPMPVKVISDASSCSAVKCEAYCDDSPVDYIYSANSGACVIGCKGTLATGAAFCDGAQTGLTTSIPISYVESTGSSAGECFAEAGTCKAYCPEPFRVNAARTGCETSCFSYTTSASCSAGGCSWRVLPSGCAREVASASCSGATESICESAVNCRWVDSNTGCYTPVPQSGGVSCTTWPFNCSLGTPGCAVAVTWDDPWGNSLNMSWDSLTSAAGQSIGRLDADLYMLVGDFSTCNITVYRK